MRDLIYEGLLQTREYQRLYSNKEVKSYFVVIMGVLAYAILTASAIWISQILNSSLNAYLIIIFPNLLLISSSVYKLYELTVIKGDFIFGQTKVYLDKEYVLITWVNMSSINQARLIKLNKVKLEEGYTYVEESKINYAFLPEKLYDIIKERSENNLISEKEQNQSLNEKYNINLEKSYSFLLNKRKVPLLITFGLLILATFATTIGLLVAYQNDKESIIIPTFSSLIIFFFFLGILIALLIGKEQPVGHVEVLKENNLLVLIWTNKKQRKRVKAISIENAYLIKDHLYLYERFTNFVFLPREMIDTLGVNLSNPSTETDSYFNNE